MSKIHVVENHHEIVPWVEQALFPSGNGARFLLTLDHHTDVLPCFLAEAKSVIYDDCCHREPEDWRAARKEVEELRLQLEGKYLAMPAEAALLHLRHDEHIDFLLKRGAIDRALVLSCENYAEDYDPRIQIICHPREPKEAYFRSVLSDSYLASRLAEAADFEVQQNSFLLDIDLDNFKMLAALDAAGLVFAELARRAVEITISRERDWVRLLSMDYDRIDSESLEQGLLSLLAGALSPER
ncbi:MAG: hypothetical protein PHS41_08145 [Victivallaceae bacterium]|nr:hypothetical protein [Victivallaceae bacterium]